MANIFDQLEQAAYKAGAQEPYNYVKDRVPMAAAGAVGYTLKKAFPDEVGEAKQFFKDAKREYLDPMKQQFKEMLPTGVSVDVNPSFTDPTLTSTLDLSDLYPGVHGSAGATIGPRGLLGNINAQVPLGNGFTGVGNYGTQGGNVGVNYAQGGFTAGVNAPIPEHTARVSDILSGVTASFGYTRKF